MRRQQPTGRMRVKTGVLQRPTAEVPPEGLWGTAAAQGPRRREVKSGGKGGRTSTRLRPGGGNQLDHPARSWEGSRRGGFHPGGTGRRG